MEILFSILVCSLRTREKYLTRLKECLDPQVSACPDVELIVLVDSGELTIGAKRNLLLQQAKGKYVAFIDDDDLVISTYVFEILRAVKSHSDIDVVGMSLIMTTNFENPELSYHSKAYDSWWDKPDPKNPARKIYYRSPNHLNPVKRELALKAGFPADSSYGEDRDYSKKLFPLLNSEVNIQDHPIYFYLNRWPKEC